jgi:hypothetical protein
VLFSTDRRSQRWHGDTRERDKVESRIVLGRGGILALCWSIGCSQLIGIQSLENDEAAAASDPSDMSAASEQGVTDTTGTESTGSEDGPKPSLTPDVERDALTYEPNDTVSRAAPFPLDKKQAFLSLSESTDTVDYYRIDVLAGDTYTLDISNLERCHLAFSVGLGPDGSRAALVTEATTVVNQVGYSENVRSHVVQEFTAPVAGVAILSVSLYTTLSGNCPKYGLTIWRSTDAGLEHSPSTREPNDSVSTAAPAVIGESVAGQSFADYTDTTDHFYLQDLTPGQDYSFDIDNMQGCWLRYAITSEGDNQRMPVIPTGVTLDGNLNALRQVSTTFTSPQDGRIWVMFEAYTLSTACDAYGFAVRALK